MRRFLLVFSFAIPLILSALDVAEKFNESLFQTTPEQIESAFPGWVPGNEAKSVWASGGEDKPTIGEIPLSEARIFFQQEKLQRLLLVVYRYASAENKLDPAAGMELTKNADAALAKIFPNEVTRYSDRAEHLQFTGLLRRNEWGEALICNAALKRGPVVILVGIYPVGGAPKRITDFFNEAASFRHRAVWDADKNALLFPVPAGTPGMPGCGFASASARIAGYYGINLTPQAVQEAIGGKEKPAPAAPAPAPAANGKKKKKSSAPKGNPIAGKDATELAVTWRAIRKIEGKTGLTYHEVLDGDSFLTRGQCKKLKDIYNRTAGDINHKARNNTKKTISFDDNPPEKIPSIDPEVLTPARAANKTGKNHFCAEVKRMLERGDLPFWCAMGFKSDPKTGKQFAGAPTTSWRIICGINEKEGKLYYVDCYTALEPTEISMDEAWAITLKLYLISERR